MRVIIMAAALAALALATTAEAKQCKDSKGHFIKCPAAAAAPAKAAPCKDAKGHFIKCSATAPMPAISAAKATPSKPMQPAGGGAILTSKKPAFRNAAKCKTGVPCGNSCIPKGKVCHK